MGEHAAVYGRPALVAAIDRRLTVALESAPTDDSVRFDLSEIGVDESVTWAAIRAETDRLRRAWEHYRDAPSPRRFAPLETADPARVVRLALGEAAHALGETGPGLVVRVSSDLPIGAGFGSSAAIAVAVIYAHLARCGAPTDLESIDRIALEVERRQHGLPSGVDGATVARGGILWAERREVSIPDRAGAGGTSSSGTLAMERVAVKVPSLLTSFAVYDTGTPVETTGTVVSAVRARRDADPPAVDATLDRMCDATIALRRAFESETVDETRIAELVRRFEAGLEALGVVPEPVRAAIRNVEANGGSAKISGAGGLRGPGAGSLLVYDPAFRARECLAHLFEPMNVRLGAEGVRLDEP